MALRRAMGQFLAVPLAVVIGFASMTVLTYWADTAWSQDRVPDGFAWLGRLLGDSGSLATLLSTIASSIITVTSITFSLLLIALQQGSSALTTQVTDQFLMRRTNQVYFGYFVGLSVFVLLSLATASNVHRPVFGTALALVLTTVALCMVVVMIYNTIEQMRPTQIVWAIHGHVLRARDVQSKLLRQTRRAPRPDRAVAATLRSTRTGYIVGLDVGKMRAAATSLGGTDVEVELGVPLGRHLAFGDPVMVVRVPKSVVLRADAVERVSAALLDALFIDDDRDLRRDAAYGIHQLATIGWTAVSTAKSNPNPGQAVIQSLRDILSRWAAVGEIAGDSTSTVVIADAAPAEALDALESLILVTSESLQAQTLADALRTVATLLPGVPDPWAERLADVARRSLASLGEHVLTRDLEEALDGMAAALAARGFDATARAVRRAESISASALGSLKSRSTRVPDEA